MSILEPFTFTRRIAMAALLCAILLPTGYTAPAATLIHRYSFSDPDDGNGNFNASVTDSVGGPAWNGTLPSGGNLTTVPNQLVLTAGDNQYVQFPQGIISNYTSLTIDMWATVSNPWGFLWSFGDTDVDTGNGGRALWLHGNARLTISDTMPSWGGEQNAFFNTLAGPIHITAVVDPPTGRLLVYTNGMLAGINTGVTRSLTNVWSINNYIAKSVWAVDGLIDLTVDEFRIWNGALNGVEVAGCDVAGPDAIGTAASVGTITQLDVTVPYPALVQGGQQVASVTGVATLFTNQIAIDNILCTFQSSDTNVLTVNSAGRIAALKPGTATVTAHYGSTSDSVAITVFPEPTTLLHRWSFNEADGSVTIADSVAGQAGEGIIPNGGTFADGQIFLSGAAQQYVSFPTNLFSGVTNATIEAWASFQPDLPWNAWFFGFGDTINEDHGAYYLFVQPQSGRWVMAGLDPGWQGEQSANSGLNFSAQTNLHLVCVAAPGGGYLSVYTNGVLAGVNNSLTYPMTSIRNNYSYINRSLYPPDPYVDVAVNEFRIYKGAMSAEQVALNYAMGPDALEPLKLSVSVAAGNLILSWPTNSAGFTLHSSGSVDGGWNSVGGSPGVSGTHYQVSLPATNATRFFRLVK
ncbi:MAG TPA: LamG-like jellyroll fold domain-containing protein [Verrucomicrobiae bacterium]|nr:LamG-like jellyroll fold domain-containing protein [Verrucomicrobiae bacterium]